MVAADSDIGMTTYNQSGSGIGKDSILKYLKVIRKMEIITTAGTKDRKDITENFLDASKKMRTIFQASINKKQKTLSAVSPEICKSISGKEISGFMNISFVEIIDGSDTKEYFVRADG